VDAAPALPVYAGLREQLLSTFAEPIGDPAKLAQALITAVNSDQPPRRLLLGTDAYEAVHAALTARLAEVQAQRDSAAITNCA
jgi:hypothetical protein